MAGRHGRMAAVWSTGLALVWATAAAAQSPPVVKRIEPLGAAPGANVRLTVFGTGLGGEQRILASSGESRVVPFGGSVNEIQETQAVFECQVPADAPLGLQSLRIAGPAGVSAQHLWLIDDLPTLRQSDDNLSFASAQPIPNQTAVDGVIGNLQQRCFRFEVEAGQRIAMEVYARRLGSQLDPLMTLMQADGRQVAHADDTPGLGGDCQLVHRSETGGSYVLELRDVRYRGGDDYPFRLRLGDFPGVQATYPLAVKRGEVTAVEFAGIDVPESSTVIVDPPADAGDAWRPMVARRHGGRYGAFVHVLLSDRPERLETEPNDTPDAAQIVARSDNLNGRIQTAGDVDCFRLTVEKGERLVFEGQTRAEGTPSDLQLRLLDAAGKQIAVADDDGANEGRLDHTFAEAGEYTLEVSELTHRGGPAFVYRVHMEPFAAGFRLAATGDALNVPAGGTAILPVQTTRLGYNGEIELRIEGLPEGVHSAPAVIGAGQTQGHVSLSLPEGSAFDARAIQVVGTASIGKQTMRTSAEVSDWVRAERNLKAVVPPPARRNVVFQSVPAPQLALSVEPSEVVFGRELSAEVTVAVRRAEGLDGEISLATLPDKNALPKEISLDLKPIPAGQDRVTLKLSGADQAPLGRFALVLQGTHKRDKSVVTAPTPVIGYRLAAPFELTVESSAVSLAAGGTHPLTVRIDRNPAFRGALTIQAEGLPAGVSVAAATLTAEAQSIELSLSATADAPPGPIANARLIAAAVDNARHKAEVPLTGLLVVAPQ